MIMISYVLHIKDMKLQVMYAKSIRKNTLKQKSNTVEKKLGISFRTCVELLKVAAVVQQCV